MNRIDIIKSTLDKTKGNTYIEIGVAAGDCFLSIDNAKFKFAIDPIPANDNIKKALVKNKIMYYQNTSDDFFCNYPNELERNGIDVAFIDGLHEYRQALRDVENCLKYLNNGGVIILHDCNPPSEASAMPALSIQQAYEKSINKGLLWTCNWCGDVWKSIVYLNSLKNNISTFVLNCDWGVGIVTKSLLDAKHSYDEETIKNMEYDYFDKHKIELINLKPEEYFYEFISKI